MPISKAYGELIRNTEVNFKRQLNIETITYHNIMMIDMTEES